MIPEWLQEPAKKVWEATCQGQGMGLYPWLENLLQERGTPEWEWVPTLEIGSACYLLHGRFAEGERLARRAIARSLNQNPDLYARAVLALARAYLCQGRQQEAWSCWHEVGPRDAWATAHYRLLQGQPLSGKPVGQLVPWEQDPTVTRLAPPEVFPLWTGNLHVVGGAIEEIPLWQPVPYPPSWDELAAWPRERGVPRQPLLQQIKAWRPEQIEARWLGSVGQARFTYALELDFSNQVRTPTWLSLEVAGSGYELVQAGEECQNLVLLESGAPLTLPHLPQGTWRLLFRGSSNAVQRGLRALIRVGFDQGPPLQASIQA